ncbi:hypothetical protein PtA15_8A681 [Puccinia triticina]|uniref:Uncharacterized protein n=1 Tax=Puccinia triticina TaxID=208348 RepID=A0ABY7CRX4_9BASI|nr:uncharacterized protein PtA15_8A681 [Puccinia triticina]WAQ87775.1 hypothetical protein PtA15_8A681 [Puccinia triticina]WAR57655.1 hypothetical protein PtB15_8B708 [Puccinia triticina]
MAELDQNDFSNSRLTEGTLLSKDEMTAAIISDRGTPPEGLLTTDAEPAGPRSSHRDSEDTHRPTPTYNYTR